MAYVTQLIRQWEAARGTRCFEFEKPRGFTYRAGQAVDVVLDSGNVKKKRFDPSSDPRSNLVKMSQTFSLVSAPKEKTLSIATRIRESGFKKKLLALKAGERVKLEGPFGSFVLHGDASRPAVFIAGGIGITPFVSMLRGSFLKKEKRGIVLFYSNHTPKDAPFLEELRDCAIRHEQFTFVPTFTASSGRIDKRTLKKYLGRKVHCIFYIAGTLAFVTALRETVLAMGVSDDDVRTDEFPGY